MLKNMFKIAWRNAKRQKQFTLLNVLGLSIGITACLLIGLYAQDEMSYDKFHEKGDRIYRINQSMIWGDWNDQFASTGPNLAVALKTDLPEFEQVTRIHESGDQIVTYKPHNGRQRTFNEREFYIAEENFFDIFSFNLLEGDPKTALKNPSSIVITKEMAIKYFDDQDAMGKTLEVQQGQEILPFTVSGIVEEVPKHSHLQFDMLASMSTYQHIKQREWTWIWTTFVTYGLVNEGTDIQALEEKLQAIPPKWTAATMKRVFGQTYEQYMSDGRTWDLYLQPVDEAYLYSPPSGNRLGPVGDVAYVRIFLAVGFLILVLSSINFMNLSTARSSNRAKEVGIRKVLGSEKRALVQQFIFEAVLFTSLSTVLAMVLTEFSLNSFNQIANKELSLYAQLGNPIFLAVIVGFMLILGILSGSYPAFYLSSFRPIEVLKGKITAGFKGKGIRNTLVVFQFAISVALIISTFFVQRQLNYATTFDIGFDRENVLQIHNIYGLNQAELETFQNNLLDKPAFSHVGFSDVVPPNVWNEDKYKAHGPDNEPLTLNRLRANEGYVDLIAPKFLAGRNFDKTRGTDKYAIILNAASVKALGWGTPDTYHEDSPIGKHVTYPTSTKALFEVIGVVDDFNFNSLKVDINPLILINEHNDIEWTNTRESYVSMRINPQAISDAASLKAIIQTVQNELEALDPALPFEYSFMDQVFENSFRSEQRMGKVLNIFTVMALTIASLGLFGLAAFSAEQRIKELGVRKVLGAKTTDLIISFSSEFTKLVVIALIIAIPLAYFAVNSWLADFPYKTPMEPLVFITAGLSALVISWLTISYQSFKAANRNPIEALRDQ
ncbi:ABC transporter permease [Roseivirga sp. E12]|uniref:ABC transporter permease n=1 Tax=Roseivirga sp. E12 TaxID=2819237 RepID=UPI001ABCCF47|nr:ABC transporter permease [Roseivirga sp. E12]MBO3700411.1 ABC transporter permease [Roseivirga sp. E12]